MSWYFNGVILQDASVNYSPQGARISITCDSSADLPSVADVQTARAVTMLIGSVADCVDDSSQWMLDSSGTWHQVQQSPFSDVYTKSEVDTLLAAKQDTLTITSSISQGSTDVITAGGVYDAVYYIANNGFLANGDDLNTLTTPGRWYYRQADASSFINRPNHTNFTTNPAPGMIEFIQVYKSGNVMRGIQRIYISGVRFFMRGYQDNNGSITWYGWNVYEGTPTGSLP